MCALVTGVQTCALPICNDLTITYLETVDTIAVHELCAEKGRTVKNTHHYRDHAQRIVDLEQAIAALIPHETAAALCAVLKRTSPRIYKDQLVAVRALLRDHQLADTVLVTDLSQRQRSEEHTSELQSLMRISYAVFCLKKKQHNNT